MIKFTRGNILEANAEALVNTVNCVGIMGRGIALQFKNMFPDNFRAYSKACQHNAVQPGRMFVHRTDELTYPHFIVNFPTKRHWKGKSRMEDIDTGLEDLVATVRKNKIKSIAIPALGSGLGGLDWKDVCPRIVSAMSILDDVEVIIYEPAGAPDTAAIARNKEVPNMTPGRAALVALLQRYRKGLMDPFVTLLEAHKLMYFMQVAGEQLRLNYAKGSYGPYAENLRHVFNSIEGHLVTGYADGGDDPRKQLEIVPGAPDDAERFLENRADTLKRFERVAELVDGFETPFGLELLSTVHWVATHEGASDPESAVTAIHNWNDRKKQFTPAQIRLAFRTLTDKGWLSTRERVAA
ncbi:Appr-1-p processing protein [Sinorhizobium meliloti]|uniref:type II toxin-antitoxin system antitoxin DNA ADP-ribosyl glycohydrolase DarG n=1 Tax=Rhizobium meliloti TaxID=382 RepID=UPI000FD99854|nr:macro domain-containing protein [Sinorhizobium meliloti]RVH81680.1 Appr-1-p processing protein [Sinorhizobium meliloti]RVM25141.1 Appr-1-p processing protein [Sinorhizobium meliloti]RVN99810.1 Appr-1-p processing protein [Sinorhizobium meliloti]